MDLILTRKQYREDGIFSTLTMADGVKVAETLEHSYDLLPKIPMGVFTCRRSMHRLHGMDHDFETFEITGVDGHINLLFHWGNYNKDSEGCILVGQSTKNSCNEANSTLMITNSKVAFADFMKLQEGVDTFTLTVC